jgi:hypothetical protein
MTLRLSLLSPILGLGLGLGLATACGSSDTADPALDAGTAVTRLSMPSISLAAGEETTVCMTLALGNATPQMLRRVHSTIAAGSHHLIAYRVAAGSPVSSTPAPCQPFADITSGATPVIIAESPDAEVVYPSGVALPVEANQRIKLEEHFFNPGDSAIQSTGTVEFELAPADSSLVAANLLFWGPQQFQIGPTSHGSADLFHLVDSGVKIFALTSHEHHFGTLATIDQAEAASAAGTELYRNTDWAHPPLKSFDPPLAFDGNQGLRVHCEWFNTSNEVVFPGLSASTNEMCFFWAYYYPSTGFQQCSEDGCNKS